LGARGLFVYTGTRGLTGIIHNVNGTRSSTARLLAFLSSIAISHISHKH
jgi:hypothetical protein